MDYKHILKKYPKSLDAFCKLKFGGDAKSCMKNSPDRFWGALSLIHDRELYDFFDGHEIRVYVTWTINKWFVWIGSDHESPTGFETRIEAEDEAWIEAFKLLEPTLK